MENRKIIIYSTDTCFRCKLVKQMLNLHNVEFSEITDIEAMKENISKSLGIPSDAVNIKATTEENLGFTGRSEGVSAHAVCLIYL